MHDMSSVNSCQVLFCANTSGREKDITEKVLGQYVDRIKSIMAYWTAGFNDQLVVSDSWVLARVKDCRGPTPSVTPQAKALLANVSRIDTSVELKAPEGIAHLKEVSSDSLEFVKSLATSATVAGGKPELGFVIVYEADEDSVIMRYGRPEGHGSLTDPRSLCSFGAVVLTTNAEVLLELELEGLRY
eukprot:2742342-Amphidinium_carterae.1